MNNEEKSDMTIDDLAILMAKSFDILTKDVGGLKSDMTIMKSDMTIMKSDMTIMKSDMTIMKSDMTIMKSDIVDLKKDVQEISSDLKSFKIETRENFENLRKEVKDNTESINGIVGDYHPHIIALEEKVFGHSTLAEA